MQLFFTKNCNPALNRKNNVTFSGTYFMNLQFQLNSCRMSEILNNIFPPLSPYKSHRLPANFQSPLFIKIHFILYTNSPGLNLTLERFP